MYSDVFWNRVVQSESPDVRAGEVGLPGKASELRCGAGQPLAHRPAAPALGQQGPRVHRLRTSDGTAWGAIAILSLRIETEGTQGTGMGLRGERRMKSQKIATNCKRGTVSREVIGRVHLHPKGTAAFRTPSLQARALDFL